MNIIYTNDIGTITPKQLTGFFEGWPKPPNENQHRKILAGSYKVWIAIDNDRCVGFINAISDGILSAYLPLLEVLPEYRGKGIGSELLRRMVSSLETIYAVDIVCDGEVAKFYQAQGFSRLVGMAKRNYENLP